MLTDRVEASLCWLGDAHLRDPRRYPLRHTTRETAVRIERLVDRIDVDTLHRAATETLEMNDLGRATLATAAPLCCDPYQVNRATGSFILVDPSTNGTIARRAEREYRTMILDADELRHGLNGDVAFSPSDQAENIRRAGLGLLDGLAERYECRPC